MKEAVEPIASFHDAVESMRLYQAVYDAVRGGQDGLVLERT